MAGHLQGLRDKYADLRDRWQAWKRRLVGESEKDDPLAGVLGTGWAGMGYQRTVGKFFYSIGLLVPQALFGLMLLPLLQYTQFRFPEITGFRFATVGLFGWFYGILDLNLKAAVDRFVPEYLVSNPRKAMQYVSFFVKYQMWSGLAQILVVAVVVQRHVIPNTEFAYLGWYLLFISTHQYPATLGLFSSLLGSFQRFNKGHLVGVYRASFVEPITQLAGGVLGLLWGQSNPAVGELFGMTIGWAIGGYVDDFFTFALGTYWLSKVLDEYDIQIREIYVMKVPREVWWSALNYSLRLMPATVFSTVMGFAGFMITVESLPGYLTYVGLKGGAEGLAKIVSWADDILGDSQPALSESYNNGKHDLCRFYLASGLKYWSFFFFILGTFNVFALPIILEIAFQGGFLPRTWALMGVMVPIFIYVKVLDPFRGVVDKMVTVSNHPEINALTGIIGTVMNLFFTWYFFVVLDVGWIGLIVVGLPGDVVGIVVRYAFVHYKILNLGGSFWRDVAWQVFAAPALAGAAFVAYMLLLLRGLWPIVSVGLTGTGLLFAAVPVLLLLMAGVVFVYMPLYSYFGGWDKNTLRDFRKCIPLTGPSLPITYPMWRLVEKFHARSPFKEKAHMKVGDAAFEELVALGRYRVQMMERYQRGAAGD